MIGRYRARLNEFISQMNDQPFVLNNDRIINEKTDQNYRYRKNLSYNLEVESQLKSARYSNSRYRKAFSPAGSNRNSPRMDSAIR